MGVDIIARLDPRRWDVVTAESSDRPARAHHDGQVAALRDVVVRATRIF